MDWEKKAREIAKEGGLVTVRTLSRRLGVSERTAVNYIYGLRMAGLVETSRERRGIRLYRILPARKPEIGFPGLYETINMYSPIKVAEPYEHRVHGKKLTPEEAIVRAALTGDYRLILASLALFRKVEDWGLLYRAARKEGIARQVGALYDLGRLFLRMRKMDGRTRKAMKSSPLKSRYIIPGVKGGVFGEIEKEWGVLVPFRRGDLRRYKE